MPASPACACESAFATSWWCGPWTFRGEGADRSAQPLAMKSAAGRAAIRKVSGQEARRNSKPSVRLPWPRRQSRVLCYTTMQLSRHRRYLCMCIVFLVVCSVGSEPYLRELDLESFVHMLASKIHIHVGLIQRHPAPGVCERLAGYSDRQPCIRRSLELC